MKKILFVVAALMISGSAFAADKAAATTTAAKPAADKTSAAPAMKGDDAVKALFEKVDNAFAKHDAKLFGELFADDATFVAPMGDAKLIKGKDAIMKSHEAMMSDPMMKDATSKHTVENVKWITKTEAFVDASAVFTGVHAPEGAPTPNWHAVAIVVNKGGKWLITDVRPYMVMPAMAAAPAKM